MEDIEMFFKDSSAKLDEMAAFLTKQEISLRKFEDEIEDLRGRTNRQEDVCVPKELEQEFNEMMKEFRAGTDDMKAFWWELREEIRTATPVQIRDAYTLPIKTFNIRARQISRLIDQLYTSATVFRKKTKNINNGFDVWLLDAVMSDCQNMASRILFIARDLEKIIESKTNSKI